MVCTVYTLCLLQHTAHEYSVSHKYNNIEINVAVSPSSSLAVVTKKKKTRKVICRICINTLHIFSEININSAHKD